MNKLICWLFGHSYRYNFVSMSNKCICIRCRRKWTSFLNEKSKHISTMIVWKEVDTFPNEKRTDEELIKQWVK